MSWTSFSRRLWAGVFAALLLASCGDEPKPMLQVGERALPFTLELLEGGSRRLEDYAGKGLVVVFMSSWCPCSNQSMPLLKEAVAAHQADSVAFLLVGIQDSRKKFEKFVQKWGRPFPAGYDKGDRIAKDYGVGAPPTVFFIDKEGTVKRAFYGDISTKPQEFRQWVKDLAG